MSENKVRIWCENDQYPNGHMYYAEEGKYLLNMNGDVIEICSSGALIMARISNQMIRVMRCTGLKDKNGKEIYESDTLMRTADGRKFVVEWGMVNECWAGWTARWIDDNHYDIIYHSDYTICEIIGNIYENPELLEVI